MSKQLLVRYGAIVLAAMAPVLWGVMYPVGRVLMATVNPFALGEARLCFAGIFYVLMTITIRGRFRIPLREGAVMVLLGVIGYGGTSSFQLYGTYLTSAHFAALLLSLTPLLLLVSTRVILGTKTNRVVFLMAIASMIGLVVSLRPWSTTSPVSTLGVMVLLIACIAWVLYSTVIQRFLNRYSAWTVMTYSSVGGILALLPPSWSKLYTLYPLFSNSKDLLLLLYLGVGSTGVAYICWNVSIRIVGPGLPALFYFFQPLVATILGIAVLHEQITVEFLIGGTEMLVCVFIGVLFNYKRPKEGSESKVV